MLEGLEDNNSELPPATQLTFKDFDLVQAKVSAGNTSIIDRLGDLGFHVCEGEIDFEYRLGPPTKDATSSPASALQSTFSTRLAEIKDIPAAGQLAAAAFRGQTRFRKPWFSDQETDLMYTTWITNAVRGEFDDVCLLVENAEGEMAGLVTLLAADSSLVRIGLLAVREASRKMGLGGYLVDVAKEWTVKQGRSNLKAATQIRNIDAMRMYTRTGAIPVDTSYWLYRVHS